MANAELGGLARRLDKIADSFTDRALKDTAMRVGQASKGDIDDAVRRDLGDQSMSNWNRNKPIQIGGRYDAGKAPGEVVFSPAKRARGPMRVLTEGRQYGSAMDMVLVGRARKDGTFRAKSRGRNQSASAGRGTWDDAENLLAERVPGRVAGEVQRVLRRNLTGR